MVLCRLGISHNLASDTHLETDGQTERCNQTLKQYLRCFVNHQQSDCMKYLPQAEFALHNAHNASTKFTPFCALFGHHPRADLLVFPGGVNHENIPAGTEYIDHIGAVQSQLFLNIADAGCLQETG